MSVHSAPGSWSVASRFCRTSEAAAGAAAKQTKRKVYFTKEKQLHLIIKVAAATFADPLPEFQFRDCGFVVLGTGFQYFRIWSFWISGFPASERRDFNISGFGAAPER